MLIENRPALEVIQAHDAPTTLHFVDPPYVHATRHHRGRKGYRHEMDDADHAALIDVLRDVQGLIVLSGYESDLYRDRLSGWQRFTTTSRIAGGRGSVLRNEVVWVNPACSAALALEASQKRLFA